MQMPNKHIWRCTASLTTREKSNQNYSITPLHPNRTAITKTETKKTSVAKQMEKLKPFLVPCLQEYKMAHLLWRTVWQFPKKLSMGLSPDPAIPLLAMYPKEVQAGTQLSTQPCSQQQLSQQPKGGNRCRQREPPDWDKAGTPDGRPRQPLNPKGQKVKNNGMWPLGLEGGTVRPVCGDGDQCRHCANLAFCREACPTDHQETDMRRFRMMKLSWGTWLSEKHGKHTSLEKGTLQGHKRRCSGGLCLNGFPCDGSQSSFQYFCKCVTLHNEKRFTVSTSELLIELYALKHIYSVQTKVTNDHLSSQK